MKQADVIVVFENTDSTLTMNYRPLSFPPVSSKVSQRLIQKYTYSLLINIFHFIIGETLKAIVPSSSNLTFWKLENYNDAKGGVMLMDLDDSSDIRN